MSVPRTLTGIALCATLTLPGGLAGDSDTCDDGCWKKLRMNLGDCREEFPDLRDPLREDCGDAATFSYRRCLDACVENARLLFGEYLAFVPSLSPGSPRTYRFLLENRGAPGPHMITVLNGDGNGGGLDHLRVLLDREVIYEEADFDTVSAEEIELNLEQGAYVLSFEYDGVVDGSIVAFVSDRPLADLDDLEG